jgi:hypothetical protein
MEEDDELQIVQQILACGILDCSPRRKREATPLKSKASDICDDGWNIDTDMSGLLVAIEKCGILDSGDLTMIDKKRPRGRPKKKAVKRTVDRESIFIAPTLVYLRPPAGNTKPQASRKNIAPSTAVNHEARSRTPIIRATVSPVPGDPPADRKRMKGRNSRSKTSGPDDAASVDGMNGPQNIAHDNISTQNQTKKRGRGRPKKRVVKRRSTGQ